MNQAANPYKDLPQQQYWRSGVVDVGLGGFDPLIAPKFRLSRQDRVVTMGSCFAQHLARYIKIKGLNYVIAEPLRPSDEALGVTVALAEQFSARYGNIYTVRQAVQLLDRISGWEPREGYWRRAGRFFDSFRPTTYPNGFPNLDELRREREIHLNCVRSILSSCDVVVFTLGLTEAWISRIDGAVFPVAPGVAAGSFDGSLHAFENFSYSTVATDLAEWCRRLRELNSRIRILLTVSPVALNATFVKQNVWTSTTYSKSVLRAAAGEVATNLDFVDYFPSYEVITSPSNHLRYLEDDLRSIKEIGVQHVMRVFDKHYLSTNVAPIVSSSHINSRSDRNIAGIICDEDLLD